MDIINVDYREKIPNNVNLTEDRRVLRALEGWPLAGIATTCAFGTAAPDGSVTRPVRALDASCAETRQEKAKSKTDKMERYLMNGLVFKLVCSTF